MLILNNTGHFTGPNADIMLILLTEWNILVDYQDIYLSQQ